MRIVVITKTDSVMNLGTLYVVNGVVYPKDDYVVVVV